MRPNHSRRSYGYRDAPLAEGTPVVRMRLSKQDSPSKYR